MATTLIMSNNVVDEITAIMNKKFAPRLKSGYDSINYYSSQDDNSYEFTNKNKIQDKCSLNEVTQLFPSIPLEKIENILNNRNISIEEGIKQLKQLTLSENCKKMENKLENLAKTNSMHNNFNSRFSIKFHNNVQKKRNYNDLISQKNQIDENTYINYNSIDIDFNNHSKNNAEGIFITQKIEKKAEIQMQKEREIQIQKEKEFQMQKEREFQTKKEKERMKERKRKELKTVDKVAQELLESRNENELKEYLFGQLLLLNEKKQNDNKKEVIKNQINNTINQLNNDKMELRKCNIAVSRALNKKIVELYKMDNEVKKRENEINQVKQRLNYHAYMGDFYNEQLKMIKENNYK